MQSGISGRILMVRAAKKVIFNCESVRHFYEVRVEDECPTIPVVLVLFLRTSTYVSSFATSWIFLDPALDTIWKETPPITWAETRRLAGEPTDTSRDRLQRHLNRVRAVSKAAPEWRILLNSLKCVKSSTPQTSANVFLTRQNGDLVFVKHPCHPSSPKTRHNQKEGFFPTKAPGTSHK